MTKHLLSKFYIVCVTLAVVLGLTITAQSGSAPSMEVTVFNSDGKVVFKGPMSANSTFATQNLSPGNYVVQFNTGSSAVKDNQYLLVVSAGKKKIIAGGVSGDKFIRGGVAMRIQVGPDLNITGQVVNERAVTQGEGSIKYRVIDGKPYVFVASETGSNFGGHWVQADVAPMRSVYVWNQDEIRKRMDRGGEGSMITYSEHYGSIRGY